MKHIKNILVDWVSGIHPRQLLKFWTRKMDRALSKIRYESSTKTRGGFAPVLLVVAALWSLGAIGVAIGSFLSLILSLLTLYFIFTKLFGIQLNLDEIVVV